VEFKLSQTYNSDFKKGIDRWLGLEKNLASKGFVVYCGEHAMHTTTPVPAIPWYQL